MKFQRVPDSPHDCATAFALRALIFDFDGLIVDTETALIDAWESVHNEDGIPCDRTRKLKFVGSSGAEPGTWDAYPPTVSRTDLWARYREKARAQMFSQPVRPGVSTLLAEAHGEGLQMAVASNSHRAHVQEQLEHHGVAKYFNAILCREDVAEGKPAPDLYLAAMRLLQVNPDETVAFEDSRIGHLAAHRAGLRVMVVTNPSTAHDDFLHATWLRDSLHRFGLDDLKQLLDA